MAVSRIRQFYDETRTFRVTGEGGAYRFVGVSNAALREQEAGRGPDGETLYRRPVFDLKIRAQKKNPFSRMEQNERAKELYSAGFFNPERAQEAMGALEMMEFEEVTYWDELKQIMAWSLENVTSTLHVCWGAQAGLYYHYGMKNKKLDRKLSGIYKHHVLMRREPLVRGFDDIFYAPHSRYTEVAKEDIAACEKLLILAESEEAGVFLCMTHDGRQVYVMGHPEYDRMTLDKEYRRDTGKGMEIAVPQNYYEGDDPKSRPLLMWRAHANALYTNWINYLVYQNTPYEWK